MNNRTEVSNFEELSQVEDANKVHKLYVNDYQDDFTTETVEFIAKKFPKLKELTVSLPYKDNRPKVDWKRSFFPELTEIELFCSPLVTIQFDRTNTPKLQRLSLSQCGEVETFYLDLPDLQSLSFEHMTIYNPKGFGPSLNRCKKLKTFFGYKLWGLGRGSHTLKLPECTTLELYRSDDLRKIDVTAPKLEELNLRACFGLNYVRLRPDTGSKVVVNLIYANIDAESKTHLINHPRVSKIKEKEEDDELYYLNFENIPKTMEEAIKNFPAPNPTATNPTSNNNNNNNNTEPKNNEQQKQKITECHKCKSTSGLKYCGKCRSVKYCSVACQQADWDDHKPHCVEKNSGSASPPSPSAKKQKVK